MKTLNTLLLLTLTLFMAGVNIAPAATVTGRSQDASIAGTEKIPVDDSGTDKYILISQLWNAMVLTGGVTASGSSAFDLSGSTGAFKTSTGANTFGGSSNTFEASITPATNDIGALGSGALSWADLFLASGGVISFNNGDVTITHSSGVLTVAGSGAGDFRVTTAGTNAASVVTVGGTQTLTNKTLTAPVISAGLTASGSASNDFSSSTGTFKTSTGLNTFGGSGHAFAAKLYPSTDDGAALGDATHHFSDLFLATGAVVNYSNGNVVLTHSSGILTLGTGELRITTAGTNAASVPTLGSTSTLTNKTLTSPVIASGLTASGSGANTFAGSTGTFITSTGANTFKGSAMNFDAIARPTSDDGAPLGDTTHNWSDLFLADGGVINYANGDVVVTHSTGILTMGTGELRITTAGTNAASVPTLGSTSTLTNKTLTAPVIGGGLTASGSASNDFSASTGTFKTSTGANTLGGATTVNGTLTVNDTTTPSITTASGKTNTGYLQINGKTSGALKLLPVDAAGQTVTVSLAAQTSGAATLTVNDLGGVGHSVMVSTLTTNTTGAANSVTGASNSLVWEGTADSSEITLDAADATADVTYRLPNAAAATYSLMSSSLATNAVDIANSVTGASNALVYEGTADAFETSLVATDATADQTITLPNATGTVALSQASTAVSLTADDQAVTPGSSTVIQLSSNDATATNRTFTLSATGAIAGQIYVLIAPASNACEMADTGIQKLSAAWSPNADDTLTLLFNGTNFIEIGRSAN